MTTPKRLPPDTRHADILTAALDLARAEGLGSLTRKRVAQAAAVSPGLVTFRFLSTSLMRDAVMQAAVDRADLRVLADGIALRHATALAAPVEMRMAALESMMADAQEV